MPRPVFSGAFSGDFSRIFNMRDEKGLGRSMLLLGTFFAGIGNIFISGTFYTGFLSENGIDIVSVGVITFIPYLSWVFALFAPQLLSRFKKRKALLLFNHCFYYGMTVVATTVMPRFVHDAGRRTLWFGILLFIGNTVNAMISSGATAWHVHFLPEGSDRNIYFSASHLVTNLTGTAAALGAALLTDALAGSPYQAQVLTIMRYVSFGLFVLTGICHYAVPKEYPYAITQRYRLRDVLVKPPQDRRFLLTILLSVAWSCLCNMNAGTWTYYLLNTVKMPYLMTYAATFTCAVGGIFLQRYWRRAIRRYNWLRVFFVNVFITACIEATMFFATARTLPLFICASVVSGINLIGAQLTVSNIFYYNLPKTDSDLYVTFYNFVVNIAVFLGAMLGTWLLAWLEGVSAHVHLGDLPVHGSQLLLLFKTVLFLLLCLYIHKVTPSIVHPEDAR